ncbi:MAG: tellurite resistance TerB C-terminal domain-containing protein, partial [Acutalibacteraceae bacterium]|nr:tellurite resistance TerB C-terminal domain-containing protein [Acutalibacteraceae bacterium]
RFEENEYYYIPDSKKYSDSKELLNRYSNYKFLSSIFYESEYGYLLLEAIDYVFQAIEKYLKKFRINWFDAVFNSIEYRKVEWHPYHNLTYYTGARISDKEVELVNGDKYAIKNGKGYKLYKYISTPYSGAIAYTIKIIENELRKALGFRAKLQPNPSSVTSIYKNDYQLKRKYEKRLDRFCTEDYRKMVEEKTIEFFDSTGIERMIMSKAYKRKKEMERKKAKQQAAIKSSQPPVPIVLEIDRSKFESIRRISEEIQAALIIEEDNSLSDSGVQTIVKNSVTPEIKEKNIVVPDELTYDNEYLQFVNSLNYLEKQTLLMIVDNRPELLKNLNQLAIDNNDMIEAIIDRINEKALEYIADNVIEFSEAPIVYEEYIEGLNKALKE